MQPQEITYEIALATLDNICSQASLDRNSHARLIECVNKLKELLPIKETKSEDDKAT